MLKPIEGSFDQCLGHYRKHSNDESFVNLGKTVRVKGQTPRRWFTAAIRPVGEYKIRVGQALIDMGYAIREHKVMPPVLQEAYALVAYGLVDINEVATAFGISSTSARDMMLSLLLGKGGTSEQRLALGEQFVAPLRSLLAEARPNRVPAVETSQAKPLAPVTSDGRSAALSAAPPPELMRDHDAVAAALAAMLMSSYPLLQFVNSDNFTPEERRKLRERLGFFGAMNISTELNRLCSEKARDQFKPEGTAK